MLDGDCEIIWCKFMAEKGMVDAEFLNTIDQYCLDYEEGKLDYAEYERYLMTPLSLYSPGQADEMIKAFLQELRLFFRPYMLEKLEEHRSKGDTLILATASNHIMARPIAATLGITNLICTQLEMAEGVPTGKLVRPAPFRQVKAEAVRTWVSENNASLAGSWGYSDSHNDIPFLSTVENPVAVTPDPMLREYAEEHDWPVIEKPQ
jgi:HAD superfamily hydrolase (TIGR01490 family)